MNLNEFSLLIEKYHRGECLPQEKELLENYLDSFQNNSGEWIKSEMGDQKITEAKIYSEILKNIKKEKSPNIYRIFFSSALLKKAASIAFIFILVSGILYLSGVFQRKADPIVWYEKVTLSGEKSQILLSDGSLITLNAGSKLKYPDQFNSTSREVYLEGEGYFVISHKINQPFILHTGKLLTTVLGTKFNISAYPENKTITVSLIDGKVKISRSENGKIDKLVILRPKEQLLYDREGDESSLSVFDSLQVVGWKDNIYKFENEPLSKVLSQLEKAFGVKFKLNDQFVLSQKITIKFENNSLLTVVDVIKSLTGLDYKIVRGSNNQQEILFFRKIE